MKVSDDRTTSLRPGEGPAAESPASGRDAKGRFLPSNSAAVTHGAHAAPERLSDGQRAVLADLDAFQAGVVTDLGGPEELSTIASGYVGKLASVEGLYRLLAHDVAQHGIFTKRGRTRATFTALLSTIDKWDRLAQRLGMTRKPKHAHETIEQWLERVGREREARQAAAVDVTNDGADVEEDV